MLRTRLNSGTFPDLPTEIPVGIIPSSSLHLLCEIDADIEGSRFVVTSTPISRNTDMVLHSLMIVNMDSKLCRSRDGET
jgi:hypothetical protein